jgi:hypothetical protein
MNPSATIFSAMGELVGELSAGYEPREKRPPYRAPRTYFVGVIRDSGSTRWTCEGLRPRERHIHQDATHAQACAEKALSDGTWQNEPPPALTWA